MSKKDFFSGHAKLYATFRPTYPAELYEFIFSHVKEFTTAWDCATGNGQVAGHLANHFDQVFATDISQQQLDNATQAKNITYSNQPAEKTNFSNHTFDLITVGQAMHWFDLPKFYDEVKRVGKPNAIIGVWGYSLCSVNPSIDTFLLDFYNNIVGSFWDDARKIIVDEYKTLSFPFETIKAPSFSIKAEWTTEQFAGYLTTWSATQKFIQVNGFNPVPDFIEKLVPLWGEYSTVTFPVFTKLGKIN